MAGDIHRAREAVGRTVRHPAVKVLLRSEGDGVKQEVEPAPPAGNTVEQRIHLIRGSDVERQEHLRAHLLRQRLHETFRPVVQIGQRQFRARRPQRCCATPGERLIVGQAYNQAAHGWLPRM